MVSAHLLDINNNKQFMAGSVKQSFAYWTQITQDKLLLDIVKGYKLEFTSKPVQIMMPKQIVFSETESLVVQAEVDKLLMKGVIVETQEEPEQFVSNIFVRPKKDPGAYRVILNLKPLNEFIAFRHFKMDSIHTCTSLMHQDCFMTSIDLQDAYYSIHIAPEHQKFLKFWWRNTLYQYTAMPMGLTSAPRIFSKLLRPALSYLRLKGHTLSIYIDDLYIQADSAEQCRKTVGSTLTLLNNLGFYINVDKSQLKPKKVLEHLGFVLNSEKMSVGLPLDKQASVVDNCTTVLKSNSIFKIRDIARILGILVSYCTGVEYGQLHYKELERAKTVALKAACGNFEAKMAIQCDIIKADLQWWIESCHIPKPISRGNPQITVQTDASMKGWGAILLTHTIENAGGRWAWAEGQTHINVLELRAAYLGLQTFEQSIRGKHVLLQMDNSTAVAYINHMGGSQSAQCDRIARKIWNWCINHGVWLSASFLPGVENTLADKESRQFNDRTEWALDQDVFNTICIHFDKAKPDIDLFASRINTKLPVFCSWRADPNALHVNAFSIAWNYNLVYLFPPFSVLHQVLQKVEKEEVEAIVIAPYWPTQAWFTTLLRLAVVPPLQLPKRKTTLYLPHQPDEPHPMWRKLQLTAWRLSGKHTRKQVCQME